ncbi:unnamed protein product, partial [marine sediment metagenome]
IGLKTTAGIYPGAFSDSLCRLFEFVLAGRVLNLFSGASMIGATRVDLSHPNATLNMPVAKFLAGNTQYWDWVLLDPPYNITEPARKLQMYD